MGNAADADVDGVGMLRCEAPRCKLAFAAHPEAGRCRHGAVC